MSKEERQETKRNIPPTPPINKSKEKKEERAHTHYRGRARARDFFTTRNRRTNHER